MATIGIRLLLIDDEEVIHQSVGRFLEKLGYEVVHASSGEEGLRLLEEQGADLVISDIRMPGLDGIGLLRELARRALDTEVVLITGHGDLEVAVEALRNGAFDFFSKPIRLEELVLCLERTRRFQEVRREKARVERRLEALLRGGEGQHHQLIGESRAMRTVNALVDKVAVAERTTVLIQGESGTGKELVARAVHDRSPRAQAPFVCVNCTAIPETLLESELFGHEKGAFTDARESRKGVFELAQGGTLFLDEIGDISLASQAKMLRVLEERLVRRVGGDREIATDVRLVSATNQDLEALIVQGRFRRDLYFRLKVFTIPLPPLRRRGEDLTLLAHYFLRRYAAELRKEVAGLTPPALDLLRAYAFPGNVRELRNLIERAVILCEGAWLTERDFADLVSQGVAAPVAEGEEELDLEGAELRLIRRALAKADGNQVQAAQLLGIGHDALRYRLKKYGLL